MDIYTTLLEVIDLRSFSSLWYWFALAVVWSSASYWVLGVPFDMIQRAKRQGGAAQDDLEMIVEVKVRRMLMITQVSGLWLAGFVAFALTSLFILGFYYWVEMAQAIFLLAFPLSFVGALALRTARRVAEVGEGGAVLHKMLMRQRFYTQIIGIVAIFVTAMFGMYQNLDLGAL